MPSKERAAMQQALEALREYRDTQIILAPRKAIDSLREALAEQPKQETVAADLMDMLRLIETIKYLRGIAERGLGREIRDDETIEQFVLGYVKQLEAAPMQPVSQEPVAWVDLTKEELHQIEMTCETSAECYRVIAKALKDRNYAVPLAQQDTHATHVVRTKDLTDDEIDEIESEILRGGGEYIDVIHAVIAADRAKNLCDSTHVEEKNK